MGGFPAEAVPSGCVMIDVVVLFEKGQLASMVFLLSHCAASITLS